MSAAAPKRNPRTLKSPTKGRDILIAIGIGAVILGFILWASLSMKSEQGRPSRNVLKGTIVEKIDYGQREELITLGKSGLKSRAGDSGYAFKVKVEPSGRVYEMPVNEGLYRTRQIGDAQEFMRPPGEQK